MNIRVPKDNHRTVFACGVCHLNYFSNNAGNFKRSTILKGLFTAILFIGCQFGHAQLFDHADRMALIRRGVDHIYNVQSDSANLYIDSVSKILPDHPAVPMMRALNVLWTHIPLVTLDTVFSQFQRHLMDVVDLAIKMDNGRQVHPEAIFFEMSARGLLAEYHADAGNYMKALSEAKKVYDLIKIGFELSEEFPEFLLTSGVYNYFREKYPEKNPVYKPFVWFFRSGDMELGIRQIKKATQKAVLTRVEAYVYLSYIYLRYEYEPKRAQEYLAELVRMYPANQYLQAKYLESLTPDNDFKKASLKTIRELAGSDRPYYRLAGESFWGLYLEKILKREEEAMIHYRRSISAGSDIMGHGEYYRSLSYLGLGRIYAKNGDRDNAVYNLNQVISIADTEDIEREAEKLLRRVE